MPHARVYVVDSWPASNTPASVTAGNVRISPEFASVKWADVVDRVDFFIPVAKWGIVITRGNRLSEHNSRFEDFGAYGAWLRSGDMTDYMLLDCRTSVPRKGHPNIPNLFPAVFRNDYQKVTLYSSTKSRRDCWIARKSPLTDHILIYLKYTSCPCTGD